MEPLGRRLGGLDRHRLHAGAETALPRVLDLLRLRANPFAGSRDEKSRAIARGAVLWMNEVGERQPFARRLPRETERRELPSPAEEMERVAFGIGLDETIH